MARFTAVHIIYNPNSTGPGQKLAEEQCAELRRQAPKLSCEVIATEYAGHAETLAYNLARKTARPLIISASGDGGYHEVINGLLRAEDEGAKPVAGLLPAGNANDHYRNLHEQAFTKAVIDGNHQTVDVLKLTSKSEGKAIERFAHSYIGLGMTAQLGLRLTKAKLNRWNEIWIVAKGLLRVRAVRIIVGDRIRSYDSLIFSNIGHMSKMLRLSRIAKPDDGKFEITAFYRRDHFKLLWSLFVATTVGLRGKRQADRYEFSTIKPLMVQLDGEVLKLDGDSPSVISIEPRRLRCIV